MSRRPLGERPLSGVERNRRYLARLRQRAAAPPAPAPIPTPPRPPELFLRLKHIHLDPVRTAQWLCTTLDELGWSDDAQVFGRAFNEALAALANRRGAEED